MHSSCSCGTVAEMVFSSSHSLFQKFGRGWGRGRRSGGFIFKMSVFFVVSKITWKHLNLKKKMSLMECLFLLSFHPPRNIIMMARVALGTWPGGFKLFRDPLLETDDQHIEVMLQ